MNLLTQINSQGANAEPGLCWFSFGFRPNGQIAAMNPITIIVDGVQRTLNLGDRIGTNDDPDVEFIDCDGEYLFIYGCDIGSPFEPCPCPSGDCSGSRGYTFDANGCCGGTCTCQPLLSYDSGLCELTYSSIGDCATGDWFLEKSDTGSAPWSVIASGTGNITPTTITPPTNGFYRLRYAPFGDCGTLVSPIVNVNCVSVPSCDCDATLQLVGCDLQLDIFGTDCPGRPWQLQYSSSGTGWASLLSGTGTTSQSFSPSQNGFYRLIVTAPGGTCTPIQTPTIEVSCVGAQLCSLNGIISDGTQSGFSETYAGLNLGQEISWKFSSGNAPNGGTVPDRLKITIGATVVLDTGALTRLSSCYNFGAPCSGIPLTGLGDLGSVGDPAGVYAIPLPTGSGEVYIDSFVGSCAATSMSNFVQISDFFTIGSNQYVNMAYGTIPITPSLANKAITVEVDANPCNEADNIWGLIIECI